MAGTDIDAMIGEIVHQRLWRRRISQEAAARATGMTSASLSRKIRGQHHWTAVELLNVTDFLHMSAGELLEEARALCAARDSNPEPAD